MFGQTDARGGGGEDRDKESRCTTEEDKGSGEAGRRGGLNRQAQFQWGGCLTHASLSTGVIRARCTVQVAEGEAHVYPRLAPTCEWDTAAAHAIVEEAGGVVLQAGKCDSKGVALEDWQVNHQLVPAGCIVGMCAPPKLQCCAPPPHAPEVPTQGVAVDEPLTPPMLGQYVQEALSRQQAVQYNKENPLNPFFVVYGKRKD